MVRVIVCDELVRCEVAEPERPGWVFHYAASPDVALFELSTGRFDAAVFLLLRIEKNLLEQVELLAADTGTPVLIVAKNPDTDRPSLQSEFVKVIPLEGASVAPAELLEKHLKVSRDAARSAGVVTKQRATGYDVPRDKGVATRRFSQRLVSLALLIAIGIFFYSVWDARLRYVGYGETTGRLIDVQPPIKGTMQGLCVAVGSRVKQGDLLFSIRSDELLAESERLTKQRAIVCAERAFKLAETEARRTTRSAEQLRYQAEFNSAWSDLIQQQAKLSVLEEKGKMQASLARTDAAPLQDLKRTVIRERFYRDSLAQELKGLVALRERSQIAVSTESDTQIAAVYDAKISAIDSDLATIGDRLSRCQVRAPVSGVVVRRYEFVGEAVDETSPVVTLLEDDSLTIDLYLSSKELNRIRENQDANVFISSTGQRCVCQVVNVDPQLQHPPANLQNFFWSGRKLALIRLRPDASAAEGLAKLPLSSTVVMKRTWTSAIRDSEFSSLWATTSSHWSFKTRPATRD